MSVPAPYGGKLNMRFYGILVFVASKRHIIVVSARTIEKIHIQR